MNRGAAGSKPLLVTAAPGAAFMATVGKVFTLLVTAGVLLVPTGGGGGVVTSRWGDVGGGCRVEVLRTSVAGFCVAATVAGAVVIVGLPVVTVVVVGAAVTMVTGLGVSGLVVGGAEVGSLNWGRKGDEGRCVKTKKCCCG